MHKDWIYFQIRRGCYGLPQSSMLANKQLTHQSDSTTEARSSISIIEVPPKIWRPKVQNKDTPQDNSIDIDDGVFDFEFYGKTVFRPKQIWKKSQKGDLIPFTKDLHQKELQKNMRVRLYLDSQTRDIIMNVIIKY